MSDNVFGQRYAATYDDVYAEKDYRAECDTLERLFEAHARDEVAKVLDLGCGTGRHAVELAERGYDVVGVDRAEGMLERARSIAADRDVPTRFELGDLRTTRLNETFDVVVMMFAVLGYQTSDDDVTAALTTVRAHLVEGGLFAFDVWYGPAVVASGPDRRERDVLVNGERWRRRSWGERRPGAPLVDVTIELEPGSGREVVRETHTVRHFTREELAHHCEQVGLRLERLAPVADIDTDPTPGTWNVIGVASCQGSSYQ